MYFHYILLNSINLINSERSYSAIYHMLTGKKSAQTIQDIHSYKLTNYFGIYKSIAKESVWLELNELAKRKLIIQQDKNDFQITNKGIERLNNINNKIGDSFYLEGFHFHIEQENFWSRFILFVQTSNHMLLGQKQFLPISDNKDNQMWVKYLFNHKKKDLRSFLNALYEELKKICKQLLPQQAYVLTFRMSGYHRIGLSKKQLANQLDLSEHDIEMLLISCIHYIMYLCHTNSSAYPNLSVFFKRDRLTLPLTQTAQKTLEYIEQDATISEISNVRNLKRATICDHIVEIALVHPSFSIEPYVGLDEVQHILAVTEQLQTRKLKLIKENLPNSIDYFKIRLVLASKEKGVRGLPS